MRVTVTGAAGFIGYHLINKLLSLGVEVQGVDSITDYYSVDLKKYRIRQLNNHKNAQNFHFIQKDVCSLEAEESILTFEPNSIIHLAAQAGVRQGLSGSHSYSKNNVEGFLQIIKVVRTARPETFLFASSSSVYGKNSQIPFSEKQSLLRPQNIYGITKLMNELFSELLLNDVKTRTRGLRFFTVYGPAGRPDMAYFQAIGSALFGQKFKKYGDGLVKRDFTFIDDISSSVIGLEKELHNREPGYFDVVNIGGGNPVSINEMIEKVEKIIGQSVDVEELLLSKEDLTLTYCDTSYLGSLIGTQSFVPIDVGLSKSIDWFRESNEDGVKKWLI